ncbi:hypothetical protein F5Y15DRAFT_32910 [Xylariaceae sp. FL0016]|nr:hypothetical protein F5Y15DRAFT_32910 [Xylariaceae sp. FL0016]
MRAAKALPTIAIVTLLQLTAAMPRPDGTNRMRDSLNHYSLLTANATGIATPTDSPTPTLTSATATATETACTPFVTPATPTDCAAKEGSLVCFEQLYCEYPTGWGVGYDPVGPCWSCD